MDSQDIPNRSFGKKGPRVTQVGLGGEGILRTFGKREAAKAVILKALDLGVAYFDSAKAYAGSEGYYGSVWSAHPAGRSRIFQASKSASRDREQALADLAHTLETMGIQHLDLWQIHDVRTEQDIECISGPGGALEAFLEAKESGTVRHIGVTGHHDPEILSRAVRDWPVDSVMMPINPAEGALGGFLDSTLPLAKQKGIAVIGMKILGGSHYVQPHSGVTPELLIRYALSQDITVGIVGCSIPLEVETLANVGKDFKPLTREEQNELEDAFRPNAERLAFYRGSFHRADNP